MKRIVALLMLAALSVTAASVEVWLTPERARQLKAVSSRPYVTRQTRLDDKTAVYHWSNGSRSWATTQSVARVHGAKSVSAWQTKLDAKDKERQALLDDLKSAKDKPTKAAIEAIINKHSTRKEHP